MHLSSRDSRRKPAVPFWYAGHVFVFGGASPLRRRESQPLSEGKGVTARWGLKEAGATVTTHEQKLDIRQLTMGELAKHRKTRDSQIGWL